MTKRAERALARLRALIAEGFEYPDAEWKVVCEFKLTDGDAKAVREAYSAEAS